MRLTGEKQWTSTWYVILVSLPDELASTVTTLVAYSAVSHTILPMLPIHTVCRCPELGQQQLCVPDQCIIDIELT